MKRLMDVLQAAGIPRNGDRRGQAETLLPFVLAALSSPDKGEPRP